MKFDIGSNVWVGEVLEAKDQTADTYYSDSIDHSEYPSAVYSICRRGIGYGIAVQR